MTTLPPISAEHVGVIPLANTSWLILIQKNTPNEQRVLAWLAGVAKGAPTPPPRPKLDIPKGAFPTLEANAGVFNVADVAFVLMVRAGSDEGSGPNSSEWELMKFVNAHGRKVARK